MNDKNWEAEYKKKLVSLDEAAKQIRSGDTIMMSAGPSTPVDLMNTIAKRYKELENVTVISGILMNLLNHLSGEYKGHIDRHQDALRLHGQESPDFNLPHIVCMRSQ